MKKIKIKSKMKDGGTYNPEWEFVPYDQDKKGYGGKLVGNNPHTSDMYRDGGLINNTKFWNGTMPILEAHKNGGLIDNTKTWNGVMPYLYSPMSTGGMLVAGNAPFKEFTGTLGQVPIAGRTRMGDGGGVPMMQLPIDKLKLTNNVPVNNQFPLNNEFPSFNKRLTEVISTKNWKELIPYLHKFRDGGLTANTKTWTGVMPLIESHAVGGHTGDDYFGGNLDKLHEYLVTKGYSGSKDIGSMQHYITSTNPRELADYTQLMKPNNKAKEIWKKEYDPSGKSNVDMSKMSHQDRIRAFNDNLWDYRAPIIQDKPVDRLPINSVTKQVADNINIGDGPGKQDWNINNRNQGLGFNAFPIPIPDLGQKIPINYRSINPNLIPYRPGDNSGELSELARTTRGLSRFLAPTAEGVGEAANLQANSLGKQGESFGKLYNDNQRQRLGVDETNQKELTEVDKYNTNNFLGQDKYRMERDYNLLTQGRQDSQDSQSRLDRNNQFQNTADWYGKTLNLLNYYDFPYQLSPEQSRIQQEGTIEKDKQINRDFRGRPTSTTEIDRKQAFGGRLIKPKLNSVKKVVKKK